MAASYIPFVNNDDDANLVAKHYADAEVARVPIHRAKNRKKCLPGGIGLWVDPCIDGIPDADEDSEFWTFMSKFPEAPLLRDPGFVSKPDKDKIQRLVATVLDECRGQSPKWISVPQLAQGDSTARNKINKMLAGASGEWRRKSSFHGSVILPIIFTHKKQLDKKTNWGPRLRSARTAYDEASASGVWVVDASLNDTKGTGNFESERFPELVKLHEGVLEVLPSGAVVVAGPYWGMNLVLWARGLITHPAIGVGGGYQYFASGGRFSAATPRLALKSLRRMARADDNLKTWLETAVRSLPPGEESTIDLGEVANRFRVLRLQPKAQIAEAYKEWLDLLTRSPQSGRALALYQDLSAAYVLGKSLKNIPGEDGRAKRPEIPAKQLMLSCL